MSQVFSAKFLVLILTLAGISDLVAEQLQAWGQQKPLPRTSRTYSNNEYLGDGVRVNTGPLLARSQMTFVDGDVDSSSAGQVIENLYVHGDMKIRHENVIIRNCYINGGGTLYIIRQESGGGGLLIENCEIYNAKSAVLFLTRDATVRNCHLHSARGDIIKPKGGLIEGNYIEKAGSAEGAHGDGIQWTGANGSLVRWNNFDMPHDDPVFANSQCIIGGTQNGSLQNITVTQNWINGGGFSVNIGGTPDAGPNIVITENLFGRDLEFRPITGESTNWVACNRWEDDLSFVSSQDSTEGCSSIESDTVSDVTFSPDPNGGPYNSPLEVTMATTTTGATIRYTLGANEEPSSTFGAIYQQEPPGNTITVTTGQKLRAIAYSSGLNDSRVTLADYDFVGSVVEPEITPGAGSFLQRPTINIATESIGADIFYTLDDSDPVAIEDSELDILDTGSGVTRRFTAPFLLPSVETVTVKAIAVKDGEISSIVSNYYTITSVTSSGDTWFNLETPVVYDNVFHFSCEITPFFDTSASSGTNTLVGFCEGPADWFSDLAVSVRFYTNGKIEAYNGSSSYQAVQDFTYEEGETYKLGMIIDIANKTYDAKVAKISDNDVTGLWTIAEDFAFRPTQSGITSIASLTMWTDAENDFSTYHNNFEFASGFPVSPPSQQAPPAPPASEPTN